MSNTSFLAIGRGVFVGQWIDVPRQVGGGTLQKLMNTFPLTYALGQRL
jgi:hypothetical protein